MYSLKKFKLCYNKDLKGFIFKFIKCKNDKKKFENAGWIWVTIT
jgi:hypothetical protein